MKFIFSNSKNKIVRKVKPLTQVVIKGLSITAYNQLKNISWSDKWQERQLITSLYIVVQQDHHKTLTQKKLIVGTARGWLKSDITSIKGMALKKMEDISWMLRACKRVQSQISGRSMIGGVTEEDHTKAENNLLLSNGKP